MEQEYAAALAQVEGMLRRCQAVRPKFRPGTAQDTLLQNRIRALDTARRLLSGEGAEEVPAEVLAASLEPLRSIRRKLARAREKYTPDMPAYRRLSPGIQAMECAVSLAEQALARQRG